MADRQEGKRSVMPINPALLMPIYQSPNRKPVFSFPPPSPSLAGWMESRSLAKLPYRLSS